VKLFAQAVRYGAVGVLNTALGLATIYACMALGVGDVLANAVGYATGLAISYMLNARWTFAFRGSHGSAAARFLVVLGIAYLANLCILLMARDAWGVGSHLAQLLGVLVYAAVGFIGSRAFAFVR
jgi:putative flippase GtrA